MRAAVLTLAILSICCGGGTASSPTATAETLELRVTTAHFRVLAGTTPESTLRAAADRLEAEYARILQNLGLSTVPVAVALYENGEFVNPASLDYVVRGAFPTLQQLNVDPNGGTQIYQLGYVFGDFIVSRWGRAAFLRLIETNADLPAALGVSPVEFEAAWQSYVRQRYLS